MTEFSSRIEKVSISGIREVFEAAGEDAINLGLGQPDFPTPDHARQAAIEAIETGAVDAYTSNKGTIELREAIAAKHDRDNGFSVDQEDIIATAGGSEALHIALEAHVDSGDEVIYPDPGFVSYEALTHIAGGEPRPVSLREDLTMAPEAVEDAITDDTAAFVVNSPANPTGAVQSEADMRAFARISDSVPDVHYHLVGGNVDSDYCTSVRQVARDAGIEDRVHFEGYVPDDTLERWYATADGFVLAPQYIDHHFEGFGLVYLEANRYGVPTVGVRDSGAVDAIDHDRSGLCVDNDVHAISDALERLFTDEDCYESLSSGATEWARENDWSHALEPIVAVLEETVQTKYS